MNSGGSRVVVFLPFLLGVAIALGVFIGYFFSGSSLGNVHLKGIQQSSKLNDVLDYINEEYVDTLNRTKLEEDAIVDLTE
jgi:carboxyl-terminal processing protease